MKRHLYFYLIVIFILISCNSWKNTLVAKGDRNDAIRNAITDFLRSDKLKNNDTVFAVSTVNINDTTLGVSILGARNKLFPTDKDKIGASNIGFPTMFADREGKLFYWYDRHYTITIDLIAALSKYKHIDSAIVSGRIRYPNFKTNDAQKAADYYFCKCNLRVFKKLHTTTAMSYYPPPKLNCDCDAK